MTCKTLQLTIFFMIQILSERCFRIDSKTDFVILPIRRVHDLTWQYMNAGRSMNVLCSFNLRSVSVGYKTVSKYFMYNLF